MGARLARGAVAGLFLLFRGLVGMVALGLAPLLLILGVLVPPGTTLLVRLGELERRYCARYLGVPIEPAAPVTKRRFWQVHKLFRDRAAGPAFQLVVMWMVLAVPAGLLCTPLSP